MFPTNFPKAKTIVRKFLVIPEIGLLQSSGVNFQEFHGNVNCCIFTYAFHLKLEDSPQVNYRLFNLIV